MIHQKGKTEISKRKQWELNKNWKYSKLSSKTEYFHHGRAYDWFGLPVDTEQKAAQTHLREHVGGKADHGKVVNNEYNFEVNGLSVFHQTRAGPDHTKVRQEDEWHRDGGVDQQPRVRPLVWNKMEFCVRDF